MSIKNRPDGPIKSLVPVAVSLLNQNHGGESIYETRKNWTKNQKI